MAETMTTLVGLISGIAVVSLISALLVILVSPSRAIQSRFVRRFVEYVGNVEMDSILEEPSSRDRSERRSITAPAGNGGKRQARVATT